MTNIVVSGRSTMVDNRSADELAAVINNSADLLVKLEPSGVWINPLHVVSISDVG